MKFSFILTEDKENKFDIPSPDYIERIGETGLLNTYYCIKHFKPVSK